MSKSKPTVLIATNSKVQSPRTSIPNAAVPESKGMLIKIAQSLERHVSFAASEPKDQDQPDDQVSSTSVVVSKSGTNMSSQQDAGNSIDHGGLSFYDGSPAKPINGPALAVAEK